MDLPYHLFDQLSSSMIALPASQYLAAAVALVSPQPPFLA